MQDAAALKLTISPYLQSITPTSVTLRWSTDEKSDSQVEIGMDLETLEVAGSNDTRTKDHKITIKDLEPFTTYYYTIGTTRSRLSRPGEGFHFSTSPSLPDQDEKIRVWVLGDPGTGSSEQEKVVQAFQELSASEPTDVILTTGDNAYSEGKYDEFREKFFPAYRALFRQAAVWPSKGNHDSDEDVYERLFSLPSQGQAGGVKSKSELYYSFNYGWVHFISINSDVDELTADSKMLRWLKEDLLANQQQWTIAYFHHAPYSRGSHDSDDDEKMVAMRKYVVPLLEKGGVDLVLGGHSHTYERSMMIKGHYGLARSFRDSMIVDGSKGDPLGSGPYLKLGGGPLPNSGAVFQLIGTSGRTGDEGELNHPTTVFGSNEAGSVVLTISRNRLVSEFLTMNKAIKDRFAIVKK